MASFGSSRPSRCKQQTLMGQWTGTLQALQHGARRRRAAAPPDQMPAIRFPPRMQELQQQYLKDAAELWSQSLQGKAQVGDKWFAECRMEQQSGCRDGRGELPAQRPHHDGPGRCGRATKKPVPGCDSRSSNGLSQQRRATSWRSMSRPSKKPSILGARALPRGCRTCCTTCNKAMCR